MKNNTWLSWSSGKDSAWSLYQLQQNPDYDVTGIFTTVNKERNRVAMHGTRLEILQQQAELIKLPLQIIEIPEACTHDVYKSKMSAFLKKAEAKEITHMAFGDLYLEDIRSYRLNYLKNSTINAVFPLWQKPTQDLAHTMIESDLKAIITCVDTKQLSEEFVGREYNAKFLSDLPDNIDPCGENGEFHSCVYAGPFFSDDLRLALGEKHWSGQFCFIDLTS